MKQGAVSPVPTSPSAGPFCLHRVTVQMYPWKGDVTVTTCLCSFLETAMFQYFPGVAKTPSGSGLGSEFLEMVPFLTTVLYQGPP